MLFEKSSREADGEGGDGRGRKRVMDGGVADGDGSGLGDDSVTMVEGVVGMDVRVSQSDSGSRGCGGSADDDFGFARLRDVGIDDGEVKVLPF